jgi:hypothetical protein
MDPSLQDAIRETLRLTRENNQMLHSMRRHAFLGSIIKFIVYAALLLAPIWFYMTYLSGSVDTLIAELNKVEGTTSAAQTKLTGFETAIKNIESHLPSFMQMPAAATTTP